MFYKIKNKKGNSDIPLNPGLSILKIGILIVSCYKYQYSKGTTVHFEMQYGHIISLDVYFFHK